MLILNSTGKYLAFLRVLSSQVFQHIFFPTYSNYIKSSTRAFTPTRTVRNFSFKKKNPGWNCLIENNNNPEEYSCKTDSCHNQELKWINISSHPWFYPLPPASWCYLLHLLWPMVIWDTKQEHIEQSKLLVAPHQGKPSKTYLQAIKITSFTVLNPLFTLSQRLAVGSVKPDLSRVFVQPTQNPPKEHITSTKKAAILASSQGPSPTRI